MKQMNDNFNLCSEAYYQFFHTINKYYKTTELLSKAISKEFPPLAKVMHIGYLGIHLNAPANSLAPQGRHIIADIYRSDYDVEQLWNVEFLTPEEGICLLSIAPSRNYHWNEHEKKHIYFFLECLFIRMGRCRMSQLLSRVGIRDFLTGALNNRGLIIYGKELFQKDELSKYNILFLNLKNFKFINQSVGQKKGDEILVKYCHTLQGFLLPKEVISRQGGDNFVAVVRKERTEMFLKFIQEVPITVSYEKHDKTCHITANVGIYCVLKQDKIEDAIDFAVVAMNEVKHSGKGIDQLWYAPYMLEKIMHDKKISQLFPKALSEKEFLVYYQPKVTLETQRLCGGEALVRWYHDQKLVPPMEFIPVLEREGTVCSLDFYVFEKVCADLRKWLDMKIEPVRISVNFSKRHLKNAHLAEKILDIMQKYEIESRYIEIELTEMSGLKDHDAMVAFLKKMRDYGISTAIDDFGTGFSSLNMLREFHMDIIKLDKSFIDKIAVNDNESSDRIVIQNIVHMVRDLKLEIISEGVETKEQADFLRKIQCNMAQGYLYDRPLPHDEFEKRLTGDRIYHI